VDLTYPLTADAKVRIVTDKSPEALMLARHSTAHLMAAAVTQLFPTAQCGIGPPTDEGFFYDFVVPRPFVPEDIEAIEARMRELASQDSSTSGRCGRATRPSASSAPAASR
jgi:threonyl-tRNA synthetase